MIIRSVLYVLLLLVSSCSTDSEVEQPLFRYVEGRQNGLAFSNTLAETEDFNIIDYLYYYNGGGVAAGDINNDGLVDLYFTANQHANALYLNKGGLQFENITTSAGVGGTDNWTNGVVMADVNGDGWLDIYVCETGNYKNQQGRNKLYINNGDLTFTEEAQQYGLAFSGFSTQAAFLDYDQDGDLDMYLLNHSVHSTENYGKAALRLQRDSLAGDKLYRNDGQRFTDVSEKAGIYGSKIGFGLGVAVGDINNDGCPDIYVSNDFHENDYLYLNNCDGTFTEAAQQTLGHSSTFSMGSDLADFNNDGWLDIMTLDMKPEQEEILKRSVGADPYNIYAFKLQFGYHYQFPRNMLHLNQGLRGNTPQFSEIGQLAGVAATDWSWSPLFCDLDNDGFKDVFVSNGIWRRPNDLDYLKFISNQQIQRNATDTELAQKMPPGLVSNYIFRNNGDLTFENQSATWGLTQEGSSSGAVYADLDNDGDLDLVCNNLNAEATILENRASEYSEHNYLAIKLEGKDQNKFGIGSRVSLKIGARVLMQELSSVRGFQSGASNILHFGLGKAQAVDDVEIRWPNGDIQHLGIVAANQRLIIQQEGQQVTYTPENEQQEFVEEITKTSGLDFQHQENDFNEFDREKLMLQMYSRQGPKIAKADVNGDDLEDLFVGGAKGQAGQLFIQLNGAFENLQSDAFNEHAFFEDTDAVFFDADQDGDQDLLVTSGGNEAQGAMALVSDRLYMNDGQGNFTHAKEALPGIHQNSTCVVPIDFNGDGALDLFIGTGSMAGYYGLLPDSYLLQNDGNGNFTLVQDKQTSNLEQLGMVTDACLLGTSLVIVGKWMPVTIFDLNSGGTTTIPDSEGWWNSVSAEDLDSDGDLDLLLGNHGLNSDLKASGEEPLELLVQDFDGDEVLDPVMLYYRQGRRYTYHSKDELVSQMVGLRKRFPEYFNFATSQLDEIFAADKLKKAIKHKAVTLASAWAENLGDETFKLHELPLSAQFAPIYGMTSIDVNQDGFKDLLAVGNCYDVQPTLGRYDASFGSLMLGSEDKNFKSVGPSDSGLWVGGQCRDIETLEIRGSTWIIMTKNDDFVSVYKLR